MARRLNNINTNQIQELKMAKFHTIIIGLLFANSIFAAFLPEPDQTFHFSQEPETHITRVSRWDVESGMVTMPKASGKLQIYSLPLGEGDATFVQCPSGEVIIVNMGQSTKVVEGWNVDMVRAYMRYTVDRVTTIVVAHPGKAHYNFIPDVFSGNSSTGLQRIILAGKQEDYTETTFLNWLNRRSDIVEFVNSQKPCITDCYSQPPLCNKGLDGVKFQYMGANLGNDKKGRSITMSIHANNFKMLLPGDFKGKDIECLLVNEWAVAGWNITHTHMKLLRHGDYNDSNSQKFLNAIQPKVAFITNAYPTQPNYHPSCGVITRLLLAGSIAKSRDSTAFACGDASTQSAKQYNSWPYQIYTTAPVQGTYNILSFHASPSY